MKNYRITVNGKVYEVSVEEVGAFAAPVAPAAPAAPVAPASVAAPATPAPAAAPAPTPAPAAPVSADGEKVTAPMPGSVIDVKVSVGQSVKKGDVLLVLEAMKMENDITSPCDGTVAALPATRGATVQAGDTLVVIG